MKKTVIITGGNSGLGYQCAKVLAQSHEWHVIIAGRNPDRIEQAANQLTRETGNEHIEAQPIDLASLQSVRAFAQAYDQKQRPPLHAIVCNAGVTLSGPTRYTQDGFEMTFAVNHLAHFLLVHLLLRYLHTPARVVFVSSGTHIPEHRLARISGMPIPKYVRAQALAFPDSASVEDRITTQSQRYTTSKLCNVLCTYEFSRRLIDEGHSTTEHQIDVFAVDPGLMPGTGLAREYPQVLASAFMGVVSLIQPFVGGIRTPEQSGRDLARLATDPALASKSGQYFDGDKPVRSSKDSYDRAKALDLWETSIELTGLTKGETIMRV